MTPFIQVAVEGTRSLNEYGQQRLGLAVPQNSTVRPVHMFTHNPQI